MEVSIDALGRLIISADTAGHQYDAEIDLDEEEIDETFVPDCAPSDVWRAWS